MNLEDKISEEKCSSDILTNSSSNEKLGQIFRINFNMCNTHKWVTLFGYFFYVWRLVLILKRGIDFEFSVVI